MKRNVLTVLVIGGALGACGSHTPGGQTRSPAEADLDPCAATPDLEGRVFEDAARGASLDVGHDVIAAIDSLRDRVPALGGIGTPEVNYDYDRRPPAAEDRDAGMIERMLAEPIEEPSPPKPVSYEAQYWVSEDGGWRLHVHHDYELLRYDEEPSMLNMHGMPVFGPRGVVLTFGIVYAPGRCPLPGLEQKPVDSLCARDYLFRDLGFWSIGDEEAIRRVDSVLRCAARAICRAVPESPVRPCDDRWQFR